MNIKDIFKKLESFRGGREQARRLQKSAAAGNVRAQWLLFLFHLGRSDWPRALAYLEMAADRGLDQAQLLLGAIRCFNLYQLGADEERGRQLLEAASASQPRAALLLGFYHEGRGDLTTARRWFERGNDDPSALFHRGRCQLLGLGGPRDLVSGENHLRAAAAGGQARAYGLLGRYYFLDRDSDQPLAAREEYLRTAVDYLRQGASGGDAQAQALLGSALLTGIGTDTDPVAALRWLAEAAKQNFPPALNQLGQCYEFGIGVAVDSQQAEALYQRARDLGFNSDSQRSEEQLQALREMASAYQARPESPLSS